MDLVFNANIAILQELQEDVVVGYRIYAPRRDHALAPRIISQQADERAFQLLRTFSAKPRRFAAADVSSEDGKIFEDLGLLIPAREHSRAVRFFQPLLHPPAAVSPQSKAMRVEIEGRLTFGAPVSSADVEFQKICEAKESTCVWHARGSSDASIPWWPDTEMLAVLERMNATPGPVALSPDVASLLIDAGIARPVEAGSERRDFTLQRSAFAAGRFCRVRLLPDIMLGSIAAYYRALVDEGWVAFGDGQSDRFCAYNEPLARAVQNWVMPDIEAILDEPLRAGMSYFAGYRTGTELKPHVDRAALGFTVSLLLASTVEGDELGTRAWPLHLQGPDMAEVELGQVPGEALVFAGGDLTHWRTQLNQTAAHDFLFIAFVDQHYTGELI